MRLRSIVVVGVLVPLCAIGAAVASHVPQVDPATVPEGFLAAHVHIADVPGKPLKRIARAEGGMDVFVQHVRLPAGSGPLPFHTHPGPAIVSIVKGALTYEDACVTKTYSAGTGFVDQGFGHVHRATPGPEGADFYVTYLVPHGSPTQIIPAPQGPGVCHDDDDEDDDD